MADRTLLEKAAKAAGVIAALCLAGCSEEPPKNGTCGSNGYLYVQPAGTNYAVVYHNSWGQLVECAQVKEQRQP